MRALLAAVLMSQRQLLQRQRMSSLLLRLQQVSQGLVAHGLVMQKLQKQQLLLLR